MRPQAPACDIGAFETTQIPVTFNTNPANLSYSVGPASYSSGQTVPLPLGSYTVSTPSPQTLQTVAETQYTFASWTDGVTSPTRMIAVSLGGVTSYTANFNTSYLLTTAANPSGAGTVSPASGTYYPSGTTVNLSATPKSGYAFSNWTGNVANASSASTTITMSGPQSVTANFLVPQTVAISPISNPIALQSYKLGATSTSNGTPSFASITPAICTVSGSTVSLIATGTCTVTATVPATSVYASGFAQYSFTVGAPFTITPNSSSETVYRGKIGAFVLDLKSLNKFNGSVKLSCAGGPTGSYCADLPETVHLNGTALALSGIFFPTKSAPGTYTITFTGVSGSFTATATAKFTVK